MIDWKKKMQEIYLIIDSGSMLYSATSGIKVLDESGNPIKKDDKFVYTEKSLEDVKYHLDNILLELFSSTNATHFIGFLDYNLKDSRRKKIDARYKSKRVGKPSPMWLSEAKEYLATEYGFYKVQDGWEADDYCKAHMEKYKELNPILITVDKDLRFAEGITIGAKDGTININTSFIEQKQLAYQLICGDEDLPGLKGKGKKFCDELFNNTEIEEELFPLVYKEFVKQHGYLEGSIQYYKHFYCLYIRKYPGEFEDSLSFQEFNRVIGTF